MEAAALVGLPLAYVALAATFRGPRGRFWNRMTATGLGLGSLALAASPGLRRRPRLRDLALGLAIAAGLYGVFQVGDRFVRRFIPGGGDQIGAIYSLRDYSSPGVTAVKLAAVVGPAEELFWRGLVQQALMNRYGRWRGAAMANCAYAGAHISSGNFTLLGAAGVAGAYWSILYAAGVPLGALIVSHSAWDVWILLVRPTGETAVVSTANQGESGARRTGEAVHEARA